LSPRSDGDAAREINKGGYHLLVDLNGWMPGARAGILAMRPVLIQIGYKNFVASGGAGFNSPKSRHSPLNPEPLSSSSFAPHLIISNPLSLVPQPEHLIHHKATSNGREELQRLGTLKHNPHVSTPRPYFMQVLSLNPPSGFEPYIVTDRVASPPEFAEDDYTEKLILLPGSFYATEDYAQTHPEVMLWALGFLYTCT
jgi:hypothetical protein